MARVPAGTPDWAEPLNTDLDEIEAKAVQALATLVGQYQTANRPTATGNSGRLIWDIDLQGFYKSNGTTWDLVDLGGGSDVTLDADGSLVVDGVTVELGTDTEIAAAITTSAATRVPTSRQIAGLDLTVDRTAAALKTALALVKSDVGLPNVDNTSDANKPVSTAQAAAIEAHRADITDVHGISKTATLGLRIVETSTGVWSADAPARAAGVNPITFVGVSDPADPTNGIDTPANINDKDEWIPL
jgi:hypothetical protein